MAKPYSDDFRKCVIDNYNQGMEKPIILEIFGICLNTLNQWITMYEETQCVSPKERTTFRKRKFSDSNLLDYVKENPSATLQQIADHLSVSHQSIWMRLKQLGVTLKKKTFFYQERDESQRTKHSETLAQIEKQTIVYIDESGLDERLKSEWARAPRGDKVYEAIPGKTSNRINVIAGLLNNQIIAPLIYKSTMNTELFNAWIEQCLLPKLSHPAVLMMDNARFHKSETTREIIERKGHRLIFLPTYSPDLNPIENYWAIIKSRVKKLRANGLTLMSSLELVIQNI